MVLMKLNSDTDSDQSIVIKCAPERVTTRIVRALYPELMQEVMV